ncbi:MAG: hypothetical protein P1P88_23985, partial [Bacteroidales bacterium]|nr:hypothetical protein [Bacteroidales bacterium]
KVEWLKTTNPSNAHIINECWSYVELRFEGQELDKDLESLKVFLKGPENTTISFSIDELSVNQL